MFETTNEVVEQRHAEQAQTHHQHAGNGTAAKRDIECRSDTFGRCLRRTDVRAHRDIHPDETASAGEHRANDEADSCRDTEESTDQYRQYDADYRDRSILTRQIGRRTRLNRSSDLLHSGVAGVLAKDPTTGNEAIDHSDNAASYSEPQAI